MEKHRRDGRSTRRREQRTPSRADRLTSCTQSPHRSSSLRSRYALMFSTASKTSCRFSLPLSTPSMSSSMLSLLPLQNRSLMSVQPDRRRQLVMSLSILLRGRSRRLERASLSVGVGYGCGRWDRNQIRRWSLPFASPEPAAATLFFCGEE